VLSPQKDPRPDFNWIAGKARPVLPTALLRGVPLLGIVLGSLAVFVVLRLSPNAAASIDPEGLLRPILLGAVIGGGIGFWAYQLLASRTARSPESGRET
jgi:hypothetical protein